jgi:mannose-6-phosphate isomerase-like protein (cupin superfamily)
VSLLGAEAPAFFLLPAALLPRLRYAPPSVYGGLVEKINLDEKFGLFADYWRPRLIANVNGHDVKIIKAKGSFIWHHHLNEDEFFLVWKGCFRVEFRDRNVELGPGECIAVPRGVEHRTLADDETWIICFEPAGVLNTGNFRNEQTATVLERI